VAVGDSIPFNSSDDCPGCTGFVDRYAKAITQATGHPVDVHNLSQHNGLHTDDLLQELKNDSQRRDALANADIIIVSISYNDNPITGDDDPCHAFKDNNWVWAKLTPACTSAAAVAFQPKLASVYSQIVALRAGKPTIFRTINMYNDSIGGTDGQTGQVTPPEATNPTRALYDAWSGMICKAAIANGFRCADTYHAFNGPDGLKVAVGVLTASTSNGHPSDKGNEVIAKVLADLGYAPLVSGASSKTPPPDATPTP
jgi:lysophospholipase L1-like esterase